MSVWSRIETVSDPVREIASWVYAWRFRPGERTKTLTTRGGDDGVEDITVIKRIEADASYTIAADAASAQVVVIDGSMTPPLPEVSIVAGRSPIPEGTPATFRMTRTGPTTAELAVSVWSRIETVSDPVREISSWVYAWRFRPGERTKTLTTLGGGGGVGDVTVIKRIPTRAMPLQPTRLRPR